MKTTIKHFKFKLIIILILAMMSFVVIGDFRLSSIIYPFLGIYIPLLIFKLLPFRKARMEQILLALLGIFIAGFFGIFLLRYVLCGYGKSQDRFINKQNNNMKLIGRDFSCFGTTGDLVLYKKYVMSKNVCVEIYYKTFPDYKNIMIDTTIWNESKHTDNNQ